MQLCVRSLLSIAWLAIFLSCTGAGVAPVSISYTSPQLQYMGRVGMQHPGAAELYWSGSSVTLRFTGTGLKALLKDEKGDNYFYIITDSTHFEKLHPDTAKRLYTLCTGLAPGSHTVQLYKLTEGTMGKTWLYGFQLPHGDSALPPALPCAKNIEFYGNSITSGYSLEDDKGDDRSPAYFNNYLTYAAITARHYNAGYHCISKSGIGLMVSWFPIIMPEMYSRLNPNDAATPWDFSRFTPNVVVIDLLQNDSWLVDMPQNPQYKARFTARPDEQYITNAYTAFLKTLRARYPQAAIICTLGSMDATKPGSPWPGYIQQAAALLGDARVYTCFFPYKNTPATPRQRSTRPWPTASYTL